MTKKLVIWVFILTGALHIVRLSIVAGAGLVVKTRMERVLTLELEEVLERIDALPGRR